MFAALQVSAQLVAFEPSFVFPAAGQQAVLAYNGIRPGIAFDEVIPSWNVENGENAAVRVEVRAPGTKWYSFGDWSLDHERWARKSAKDQKDDLGTVLTDTLRFGATQGTVDIRVTLSTLGDGSRPRLKLLALNFSSAKFNPSSNERSAAWGKVIEVPQRAQGNYENGGVLCSPTSLSMVLWHYANQLQRPELNQDVPEVQKRVWDHVYDGAGNWPFNAAYAGSFPGLRSYIARLDGIADAEAWIAAGYPLICSAPLDLLRGKERDSNSGHLVVLVGFTAAGDPIFNDPAKKDEVRRIYKREDFERAWLTSRRTVYVVMPEGSKAPSDSRGMWLE
ncbi:MAG TPA: C39 family peptidase [Fimbriimonas sp.]|nr:C39 family peptidase [Fimbriimonas sp.]